MREIFWLDKNSASGPVAANQSSEKRGSIFKRDPWKRNRRTKVGEFASGHDDSIDDVPPVGFNKNDLTVTLPPSIFHVTSAQMDRSAQKGGPSTQAAHISDADDAENG
jgi:hypothetical protein